MDRDAVREIKDRIDIVEYIGETVPLRKAGRSFKGICPFHSEKTPSFHVSSERQTYHCFGCGRGGDIFSFVMEREGLAFPEALSMLAERAGIRLDRGQPGKERLKGVAGAMEAALAFFRRSFLGPEGEGARKYLLRRGITAEIAAGFELGWAPSSWDLLKRELEIKGISASEAFSAGLFAESGGRVYDRFRGRIIFPIRDVQGKLVAFGGRLVDGDGAKYINSPEGELYSKRRNLYLLNTARQAVREKGRSILVEGYMDAIKLHIAGYNEAVASLGTSLTEDQASLLKRFGDQCLICYDSDTAGQEAAIRGMYILQRSGLDIRVVVLPSGKDPDDLLGEEGGQERFKGLVQRAEPLPLFHIRAKKPELSDETRRTSAQREIIEGLAGLPPLEANRHISQVAQGLGILLPEMLELVRNAREGIARGRKKGISAASDVYKEEEAVDRDRKVIDPWEAALCYLLWTESDRRADTDPADIIPLISSEDVKSLAVSILSGDSAEELRSRWAQVGDPFPMRLISSGWAHCEKNGESGDLWNIVVSALGSKRDRSRFAALREKHARGEASPEEMKEYMELARRMKGGIGKV